MFKTRILALLAAAAVAAGAEKLTDEQRVEIIRGMTAEYATAKIFLPRSKKALEVQSTGQYDKSAWDEVAKTQGPAARAGDLVQITKVKIGGDRIEFEINGGAKGGRKWYENVQVGMGTQTAPISQRNTPAPGGTSIALVFDKNSPPSEPADIKKMLTPILNFERRTATEQLMDTLPPEIQAAVKEQRAVEGMDRDQVILAVGKPRSKVREVKEGVEHEDWIYGQPPGKVTFVTFANGKVVRVHDAYAGLGGSTMPTLKPQL